MSVRNPTDFNTYNDLSVYGLGKPILQATPNAVVDDQHFILDAPQLILSHCWAPVAETSISYVTHMRFTFVAKHMCGDSATENHTVVFYAYKSGAGAGKINFLEDPDGAANANVVDVSNTSAAWVGSGGVTLATDGSTVTADVQIRSTDGATSVVLLGIALYAPTT